LAAAESNRAIPAYQAGPVDRLGRGQRKRGGSNAQGRSSPAFKAGAVANLLALPSRRGRESDPQGQSSPVFETGSVTNRIASPGMSYRLDIMFNVSQRLAEPENRVCENCSEPFATNWAQRLCNPCRYDRATRSVCATCGAKTGLTGRQQCGACRYGTPPPLRPMTPAETAWLTGIVEGEGTFVHGRRPCGQIRVVMTDEDVIRRLQSTTGLGIVHDRGRRRAHYKTAWEWAVIRRENVCVLAMTLAPLLLRRRRAATGRIFQAAGRSMPAVTELQAGSSEAWAWVAGLLEGEGWMQPGPETASRKPVIAAESTDRDVIDRLAALTGVGHIMEIRPRTATRKLSWRWSTCSQAGVRLVLSETLPLFGERRAGQAWHVLRMVGA
jgi:hypothetical protein